MCSFLFYMCSPVFTHFMNCVSLKNRSNAKQCARLLSVTNIKKKKKQNQVKHETVSVVINVRNIMIYYFLYIYKITNLKELESLRFISLKQNFLVLSIGFSVWDLDLTANTYQSNHSLIYLTRNNDSGVSKLSCFFELVP